MKKSLKILVIIATSLVVLVGALLAAPFLIDFNKFKPQIQEAVAKQVHARIDFDSARLTILEGLGVQLTDVSIISTAPEFKDQRIFHVNKVQFFVELLAMIKEKKLVGHVEIAEPDIVFLQKADKNVFGTLVKSKSESAPEEKKPAGEAPDKEQINDITRRVVIQDLAITKANFSMQEYNGKSYVEKTRISDLNLIVRNIGANRDILTSLSTKVAVAQAGAQVNGPISLEIRSHLKTDGAELKQARFLGKLSFDKLSINVNNAFIKAPGIPLHLSFKGSATPKSLKIDSFDFKAHTLTAKATVSVSSFDTLATVANLALQNPDLAALGDLLPQHKAMLTGGKLNVKADLAGALKTPNTVKAAAQVSTVLKGADLNLSAKLDSMQPPVAQISVNSRSLDLDTLLRPFLPKPGTPQPAPTPTPVAASTEAPGATKELIPQSLKDKLAGSNISFEANLGRIKFGVIDIRDFMINLRQEGLRTNLAQFSMGAFQGHLRSTATVDIAPPVPAANLDFSAKFGEIDVIKLASDFGVDLKAKTPPPADKPAPAATPAPAKDAPPAKDLALTPEQKRLLAGLAARIDVAVDGLKYDTIALSNLKLRTSVQNLTAGVDNFSFQGFDGSLKFMGRVDLAANPIAFQSATELNGVEISKLIAAVKPEHAGLLKGRFTLSIPLSGKGTTVPTIEKSLTGKGAFLLENGELNTTSVVPMINAQVNQMIGGLSVAKAADKVFKSANDLLAQPMVSQLAQKSGFDMAKIKADYEGMKAVKVSEDQAVKGSLKRAEGSLEINNGRIAITSKNASPAGTFDFLGSVGLDLTLQGSANFAFAETTRARMLSQSRHADLLFDDKGGLVVPLSLGGTVTAPKVSVNTAAIQSRFVANATKRVDEEVVGRLKAMAKGQLDRVKDLLNQKKAEALAKAKELEAKARAEKEAAQKKLQEKAKAEKAKAEGKAKEAGKKAVEKAAGEKLKGLFGK